MSAGEQCIQQGINLLGKCAPDELLSILTTVLQERTDVLQALIDWATPDHCYGSARAVIDLRCSGVIKSFSAKHGYGFIASEEILQSFGMDLLVSDKQIRHFTVGEEVDFAILLNKGKPQAFDLAPKRIEKLMKGKGGFSAGNFKGAHALNDSAVFGTGYDSWGWGAPAKGGEAFWSSLPGKGSTDSKSHQGSANDVGVLLANGYAEMMTWDGGGRLGQPAGQRGSQLEVPGVTDTRWIGTVKSFKEGKFGFLNCTELQEMYDGQEIYVHWDQMGGYTAGDTISFAVIVNEANRLKAVDLQGPEAGTWEEMQSPVKRSRRGYGLTP